MTENLKLITTDEAAAAAAFFERLSTYSTLTVALQPTTHRGLPQLVVLPVYSNAKLLIVYMNSEGDEL
jgi:hypothetical protein